jgi:single-stranded-DNA-specific exonuclease
VAARLAEEAHRPVALVSLENGCGRGSARSVEGFHLVRGLHACRHLFHKYGGHQAAAGFELPAERLTSLQEGLEQAWHEQMGDDPPEPTLQVDGQVKLADLNEDFFHHLERLRPFGPGNPEPILVCDGVECLSSKIVGEKHLKVELVQAHCRHEAIAFDMAGHHPLTGPLEVAVSTRFSYFQGRTIPELRLLDWSRL